MWDLGRETRVTNGKRALALAVTLGLQSAALAQAKPTGLAAHESLLTSAFFGLLLTFVALVAWEVADSKKASRSSLDIAKLAAAAAKKQSAAGAPSGSLAHLDAPPTSRPFAPPPPPPPPKQPAFEPSSESSPSPFSPPSREEPANNPFAAPPVEMIGAGTPGSLESTVAFNPGGADAGSSGGWADLLQRVRAGEPEAASFEAAPMPSTEDESFSLPTNAEPAVGLSPASSSEAWEALLKRTTTGDAPKPPGAKSSPTPGGDVSKISLNSNFQLPGEAAPMAPATPSGFGMGGGSPFGGPPSGEEAAPPANAFGSSFDDGSTFPGAPPAFSLPGSTPAPEPSLGAPIGSMGFSFSEPAAAEPASPFGGFGGGNFGATPPAGGSGGFESPSFKLPGSSAPTDDFGGGGSGGFQLPGGGGMGGGGFGGGGGGNNPFDFGGAAFDDNPSSSTLPLSDLFSSKPSSSSPPAFQLPSGGGPLDFGGGMDDAGGNPALGRTISLDFGRGGGQKPPPPLPKTEG